LYWNVKLPGPVRSVATLKWRPFDWSWFRLNGTYGEVAVSQPAAVSRRARKVPQKRFRRMAILP
jgi:hypothetical protein